MKKPMTTKALYTLARKKHHTVDHIDLHSRKALAIEDNGECFIALDTKNTETEEKEGLAHELGHCETAGFYNTITPLMTIDRIEYKANKWAFLRLFPIDWIKDCIKHGCRYTWDFAERTGLSEEFVTSALKYYADAGLIKLNP